MCFRNLVLFGSILRLKKYYDAFYCFFVYRLDYSYLSPCVGLYISVAVEGISNGSNDGFVEYA